MTRNRLTWVIVGAVVALLVVAGVDALLSSDGKTTASRTTGSATSATETTVSPTTASTTTGKEAVITPAPPCTRRQIEVSIEVLKLAPNQPPVAALVMRGVGATCWQDKVGFLFTIRDRRGRQVGRWQVQPDNGFGGLFQRGVEGTFAVHDVDHCDYPGPYVALVTVGPYSARRGNLSRSEITCGEG